MTRQFDFFYKTSYFGNLNIKQIVFNIKRSIDHSTLTFADEIIFSVGGRSRGHVAGQKKKMAETVAGRASGQKTAVKFFFGPFCDRPVCTRSAVLRPFSWPATTRSVRQLAGHFAVGFILADSLPATSRFSKIWPATSRSVSELAGHHTVGPSVGRPPHGFLKFGRPFHGRSVLWPALERSVFLKTVHRRSVNSRTMILNRKKKLHTREQPKPDECDKG
ncbi:hypothetical protein BpHYR1_034458 [Brachionus plicatilis]|uniref:Uncharacterized protein n=1 Tax=Brachionus plicatilis TaxID=10195 RepID=A0A3M7SBY2_BRAPC|nr:hypothetical protein BpHYR1_034458 [Brachionus plicatilis]